MGEEFHQSPDEALIVDWHTSATQQCVAYLPALNTSPIYSDSSVE